LLELQAGTDCEGGLQKNTKFLKNKHFMHILFVKEVGTVYNETDTIKKPYIADALPDSGFSRTRAS